jgi:acetylornithine deacetylase
MNLSQQLSQEAIELLQKLIACPSFSKEETGTAAILAEYFGERNIPYLRKENNIWARNQHYNKELPTILLNSHHDTVKPNAGYTRNPFEPSIEEGALYGLGSNDAGGPLVSLIATFMYFYYRTDLRYNLILVASAEEEITGKNGLELLFNEKLLQNIDFAIVGEPTQMQLAIAEKGLVVLDCTCTGKAGHAARNEGDNAISKAIKDISWIESHSFERVSPVLGPVKATVTIINAGSQHNVVPDSCTYTVDVRVNECYTLEEIVETFAKNLTGTVQPRSLRLRSSGIDPNHAIVLAANTLNIGTFGSPTLSDQAVIPYPSVKIGPGHSARSHTANEYILVSEIEEGIALYIKLLGEIIF